MTKCNVNVINVSGFGLLFTIAYKIGNAMTPRSSGAYAVNQGVSGGLVSPHCPEMLFVRLAKLAR